MHAIGIIVEYNPLHNGHLFHLKQAKQLHPEALVIAVMSGNFLQRGEPALLDKWTRTQLTLAAGVDLIFELPYAHAVQKADQFAHHSVAILNELQVTHLIFGSELGNIEPFELAWEQFLDQPTLDHQIRPLEQTKNLLALTKNPVFASPNNTLGFWYLAAQKRLNSAIHLQTIARKAAAYHDEAFHGTIASATAIRQALTKNWDYTPVVPTYTAQAIQSEQLMDWECLYPQLRHILLTTPLSRIARFGLVSEGLESRLQHAATQHDTFANFIQAVKTKRYSRTHLQRVCTHILTQTTQQELDQAQTEHYLRLLGASPQGFAYLGQLRNQLTWPIVTNLKQSQSLLATLEQRATFSYRPDLGGCEQRRKPLLKHEVGF
ncbi:MAG: nucleotidyltransferase [Culicoidibacterales bacterium]